jgi:putative endonuclease
MYYVYLLICNDNKTYVGCTNNLKDRISRHKKGQVLATQDRIPVKLLTYFAFRDQLTAFNYEKYLKSGSGRVFLKKHLL